jgi:hypothetical protein
LERRVPQCAVALSKDRGGGLSRFREHCAAGAPSLASRHKGTDASYPSSACRKESGSSASLAPPSPRQVSFWFLDLGQPREPDFRDRAHTLVTELCARVPSLQAIRDLGRDFMAPVRQRRAKTFPAWLAQVQYCPSGDLKAFARSLASD